MTKPIDGRARIQIAATPTRISELPTNVRDVDITASPSNTGTRIWIGTADVRSASGLERGAPMEPGSIYTIEGQVNLQDWWICSETAGDAVTWLGTYDG